MRFFLCEFYLFYLFFLLVECNDFGLDKLIGSGRNNSYLI